MQEEEISSHESYAQIRLTRTSGRQTFFGSDLDHQHYIGLEIVEATVSRDLSRHNNIMGLGKNIVRVRMTPGQFSELITGIGSQGVPCTLERVGAQRIEPPPVTERTPTFVRRKLKERMADFAKTIAQGKQKAIELVRKKKLTTDECRQLEIHLNSITQEIEQNIPFFMECFQETMDDIVLSAKIEIENAAQHKITELGMQALAKEIKTVELLTDNTTDGKQQ